MIRAGRPLFFACLILLSPVSPLAAQEPPVVKALLDSAALHATGRPTYTALDIDPDGAIRLKGVTMTLKGAGNEAEAANYEIEELRLTGVSERAAGKFEVAEVVWSGLTLQMGSMAALAFPLVTGRTVYINQPSDQPSELERLQASNVRGKEFVIPEGLLLVSGQSVSIENVHHTWDGDPDTGAGLTQFDIASVKLPGDLFKQADGSNPLSEVGYEALEFGMSGKGITTVVGDATGFDFEVRLTGKEMGSIIMSLAADGIPASVLAGLSSGEPDLEKLAQQAQTISIRRAKLRFEDASVTNRLLAFAAKTQGTDQATLIANALGAAQAAFVQLNAPALSDQAMSSLSAFLKEPRSITLSLAPAQPVLGAQLMQAAQNPTTLLQLLAVSVTAND